MALERVENDVSVDRNESGEKAERDRADRTDRADRMNRGSRMDRADHAALEGKRPMDSEYVSVSKRDSHREKGNRDSRMQNITTEGLYTEGGANRAVMSSERPLHHNGEHDSGYPHRKASEGCEKQRNREKVPIPARFRRRMYRITCRHRRTSR